MTAKEERVDNEKDAIEREMQTEVEERSVRLLSSLQSLTATERYAFLGWFAGGNSHVTKYANRDFVFFGKAECEWVPFDFWLTKLPALGLITITEERRGIAKGAIGQPEFVEYKITATDVGFAAREAWWNRLPRG
jgi:hypothetical protein